MEEPLFSTVKVMFSELPPCKTTWGLSSVKMIAEWALALPTIGVIVAKTIKNTKNIALFALRAIRPSRANITSLLSESEVWVKFCPSLTGLKQRNTALVYDFPWEISTSAWNSAEVATCSSN